MSNSSLVNYTKISPNSTNPRNNTIKKITIHHMAGDLSVETCGNVFANASRQASSNYGIGSDGRIGLYVEEKNRAWTSGNADNDNQAITIEVANCGGSPDWKVSDKALAALIDLCVDICKRNGIKKLNYTGDASGNLTRHNMFQATTCPGAYLQSKFPYIEQKVNERLETQNNKNDGATVSKELYRVRKSWNDTASQKGAFSILDNAIMCARNAGAEYEVYNSKGEVVYKATAANALTIGCKVRLAANATYYDGKSMPAWVKHSDMYVREINGDRVVISTVPTGAITGAVHKKYLTRI